MRPARACRRRRFRAILSAAGRGLSTKGPDHAVLVEEGTDGVGRGSAARPRRAHARAEVALRERRAARAAVPARARELALFGMGCFWGAERKFWQTPGVVSTSVGYAGGFTPNPTYEEVCSGLTGHAEVVRVVFDPARVSYEELLRVFWESHDPTQGMRQGNDVGTQYRSAIYTYGEDAAPRGRGVARRVPEGARRGGPRGDHDRDPRGARVLLRRGLPPAVPRQEPERLLRPRRHGRRRARSGSPRGREARAVLSP